MKGSVARTTFLAICLVLAILALFRKITPVTTGVLFAVSLLVLGVASRGFKKP
jgi:hypothetical protein